MSNGRAQEREQAVAVGRGLYLLRYTAGANAGSSPIAKVRPARGSEPYVEVISAPGFVSGLLSAPGDCLVVRSEQDAQLTIKISAIVDGGLLDASFQLEPVYGRVKPSLPTGGNEPAIAAKAVGISLLAHVARRGDLVVAAGEWIAGPDAPAQIEGIELRGDLPVGVNVELQPLVGTRPARWLDWAPVGVFVGTRGRALPLAGLRLRLSGDKANEFALDASALFLGAPIVDRRGRDIELVSTTGGDPLIGLRIDLKVQASAPAEAPAPAGGVLVREENAFLTGLRQEPRVRVFRAAAV